MTDNEYRRDLERALAGVTEHTTESLQHRLMGARLRSSREEQAREAREVAEDALTLLREREEHLAVEQTLLQAAKDQVAELQALLRGKDARLDQAEQLLQSLVDLKDYKDIKGKDDLYKMRQPQLWREARQFLSNDSEGG